MAASRALSKSKERGRPVGPEGFRGSMSSHDSTFIPFSTDSESTATRTPAVHLALVSADATRLRRPSNCGRRNTPLKNFATGCRISCGTSPTLDHAKSTARLCKSLVSLAELNRCLRRSRMKYSRSELVMSVVDFSHKPGIGVLAWIWLFRSPPHFPSSASKMRTGKTSRYDASCWRVISAPSSPGFSKSARSQLLCSNSVSSPAHRTVCRSGQDS